MTKSLCVNNKYIENTLPKANDFRKLNYLQHEMESTSYTYNDDFLPITINHNLPIDINIFSELPEYVYNNERSKEFLAAMRNALEQKSDMIEELSVSFSKLIVSEHTSTTLVLDWIFNYFRMYFAFEADGDDSYGYSESNPLKKGLSNQWHELKETEYRQIADEMIGVAIEKARG